MSAIYPVFFLVPRHSYLVTFMLFPDYSSR